MVSSEAADLDLHGFIKRIYQGSAGPGLIYMHFASDELCFLPKMELFI